MTDEEQDAISRAVADFLQRYSGTVAEIAEHSTHVFEAMCYVIFARYYETRGYCLQPKNLMPDRKFRFRFSTNGNPWNFSYFAVYESVPSREEGREICELRHNQKVAGAWIEADNEEEVALFALDVAVIRPNSLPLHPKGHRRNDDEHAWVENKDLITFAEAKSLMAYPMLLAQFIGVVHEVKPSFIHLGARRISARVRREKHPLPSLMTANRLTQGTINVLKSFRQRRLRVCVIDNVTTSPEPDLLRQLTDQTRDALK